MQLAKALPSQKHEHQSRCLHFTIIAAITQPVPLFPPFLRERRALPQHQGLPRPPSLSQHHRDQRALPRRQKEAPTQAAQAPASPLRLAHRTSFAPRSWRGAGKDPPGAAARRRGFPPRLLQGRSSGGERDAVGDSQGWWKLFFLSFFFFFLPSVISFLLFFYWEKSECG